MIVIAQDGQKLELEYTTGYFTVCKVSESKPKPTSEALSQELSTKVNKHSLKTYANVTGLNRKCKEWLYVVEDLDVLEKALKLEEGISIAKKGKALKDRGGINK